MTHFLLTGMDARVALANARIAATVYGVSSDECREQMFDAAMSAESQGRGDWNNGDGLMPSMFTGEKFLMECWERGFNAVDFEHAMSLCPGCNNGSGDPCANHG